MERDLEHHLEQVARRRSNEMRCPRLPWPSLTEGHPAEERIVSIIVRQSRLSDPPTYRCLCRRRLRLRLPCRLRLLPLLFPPQFGDLLGTGSLDAVGPNGALVFFKPFVVGLLLVEVFWGNFWHPRLRDFSCRMFVPPHAVDQRLGQSRGLDCRSALIRLTCGSHLLC